MVDLQEKVRRGVELLDRRAPGWRVWIDLPTLDLCCSGHCILGQLCRSFPMGCRLLFGEGEWESLVQQAMDHGFFVALFTDYESLTALWRQEIGQG